jgi:FkbM family methyltransferase
MVASPNNYEREDLDLMIGLIGRLKLSRMFDVGANLGLYAFTFSATAHDGRVVAFEPDEVNAKLFDTSNARCPRRNIVLERKAVSATPGSAVFLVDDMSGATGSLNLKNSFVERNYGGTPIHTTVETTTIDEASKRFFPPDFIKIDVEGAELSVLEGAAETLATTRPVMLIEINTEAALERARTLLNGVDYILRPASAPNYLAYPRQVKLDG